MPNKSRTMNHPDFGELQYSKRSGWNGNILFHPENRQIAIHLPGDESSPFPFCASEFKKLESAYQTLRDAVGSELLRAVKDYTLQFAEDPNAKFPDRKETEDVRTALVLIEIEILQESSYQFIFCFSDSNDDSLFSVRIDNGAVSAEYIGD